MHRAARGEVFFLIVGHGNQEKFGVRLHLLQAQDNFCVDAYKGSGVFLIIRETDVLLRITDFTAVQFFQSAFAHQVVNSQSNDICLLQILRIKKMVDGLDSGSPLICILIKMVGSQAAFGENGYLVAQGSLHKLSPGIVIAIPEALDSFLIVFKFAAAQAVSDAADFTKNSGHPAIIAQGI